jgi:hypothetical protein
VDRDGATLLHRAKGSPKHVEMRCAPDKRCLAGGRRRPLLLDARAIDAEHGENLHLPRAALWITLEERPAQPVHVVRHVRHQVARCRRLLALLFHEDLQELAPKR